jgi:glycosyltransferase involved in cell wall biosynthesis
MNADQIRLTAAICTRQRPVELRRAITSLLTQDPPADEILVVDNNDAAAAEPREGVRTVHEPVQGLDFARNRALREARGDVVAFLDDDAVAEPGWTAALRRAFLDPRVAACTGRVEPLTLETEGQRLFEDNGGFGRGERTVTLPDDAGRPLHGLPAPLIAWAVSMGSGCSLAVRRQEALAIGGFDEALDLGAALPGGGDHDMLWRLLGAGHRIMYAPEVTARHEHRRDTSAAIEQIIGHQRALVAWLSKHAARGTAHRGSVAAFLGWRLLKPGVRLLRRAAGRDPLPAGALFRMWGQCWRGLGAYPAAQRTAARRREAAGT